MNAPEDQNGLREALALEVWHARYGRREPEEVVDRLIAGPLASLITERDAAVAKMKTFGEAYVVVAETAETEEAHALAAEAEITRLKEGMEARERANDRLMEMVEKLVLNASVGRVPLAIISAANHLLATLSPKEHA